MRLERYPVGPVQANAYLLIDDDTGRSALIDPGGEGARLVAAVEASGAALEAVWLTHAHFDHVAGLEAVLTRYDVPVYLHPADRPLYDLAEQLAAQHAIAVRVPEVTTVPLDHGSVLTIGGLTARVLFTPGHAPGHCAFYIEREATLFSGDALFRGSIGRTDLPTMDGPTLLASISRELLPLPGATRVWPGHGPASTIDAEIASNPFLVGLSPRD